MNDNGLRAFGDRVIRSKVTEYYSRYTGIRRFEDVYTELIFRVFNYFSASINFAERKMTDPSIINRTETRNLLLMVEAQLNDGISKYEQALTEAKELLSTIETAVKQ